MRLRETTVHGDFRSERVVDVDSLLEFRLELVRSPYPMPLGVSDGNTYVQAAWEGLQRDGRGQLGWAEYVLED